MRRLTNDPKVSIRWAATLAAIEEDRLLLGHGEWLDACGPVVVSQGTRPRVLEPGEGGWRTVVLGESSSAADAIRHGAAVEWHDERGHHGRLRDHRSG